ncbi:putative CBL-interacting protein kinase 25 [Blattamonas nauphoetae]|uniref:CBL-interacting protein kinase 25 n=1 Tax=Blattamonas nauphoetae TaxID=2049346 RepID=A0ABQ9XQR6_9EUKA|nr:putative CBL-interacting protein kinase 25 [Blattamonas nauphoetae]
MTTGLSRAQIGADSVTLAKEEYSNISPLGTGQFGRVYKGTNRNGQDVAIKIVPQDKFSAEEIYTCATLQKQQCSFIVGYFGSKQIEDEIVIEMEYCNSGNLQNLLKNGKYLGEFETKRLLKQIRVILVHVFIVLSYRSRDHPSLYLHPSVCFSPRHLLRSDIKPENILLHCPARQSTLLNDCVAKISDFGLSRSLAATELAKTQCGTPLFMAPEVFLEEGKYTNSADMWSVGVILYYLLSGRLPFPATSSVQLIRLLQSPFPPLHHISAECHSLLCSLLCPDPTLRISAKEALKHSWFSDLNAIEPIPPTVLAQPTQNRSEMTFLDQALLIKQNLILNQRRQSSSPGLAVADNKHSDNRGTSVPPSNTRLERDTDTNTAIQEQQHTHRPSQQTSTVAPLFAKEFGFVQQHPHQPRPSSPSSNPFDSQPLIDFTRDFGTAQAQQSADTAKRMADALNESVDSLRHTPNTTPPLANTAGKEGSCTTKETVDLLDLDDVKMQNEGDSAQQRETSNLLSLFNFDQSSGSATPSAQPSLVSTPPTLHPALTPPDTTTPNTPHTVQPLSTQLPAQPVSDSTTQMWEDLTAAFATPERARPKVVFVTDTTSTPSNTRSAPLSVTPHTSTPSQHSHSDTLLPSQMRAKSNDLIDQVLNGIRSTVEADTNHHSPSPSSHTPTSTHSTPTVKAMSPSFPLNIPARSPRVDRMRQNSESIPSIPSPPLSASPPRISPSPPIFDSLCAHSTSPHSLTPHTLRPRHSRLISPSPSPSTHSHTPPPSQFGFLVLSEHSDIALSLLARRMDSPHWKGLSSSDTAQAKLAVVACVEEHLMQPLHSAIHTLRHSIHSKSHSALPPTISFRGHTLSLDEATLLRSCLSRQRKNISAAIRQIHADAHAHSRTTHSSTDLVIPSRPTGLNACSASRGLGILLDEACSLCPHTLSASQYRSVFDDILARRVSSLGTCELCWPTLSTRPSCEYPSLALNTHRDALFARLAQSSSEEQARASVSLEGYLLYSLISFDTSLDETVLVQSTNTHSNSFVPVSVSQQLLLEKAHAAWSQTLSLLSHPSTGDDPILY